MIQIDDKIISLDLFEKHFVCDLEQCAGVCCVYGDSGAPLEEDEVEVLREEYENFEPYMTPLGRNAVDEQGVAVHDSDGDLVTPLVGDAAECAYSYFTKDGVCLCAIEKAYFDGKTSYRKPISCHLYPIRTRPLGDNLALNYDQWTICKCARDKGAREGAPVFRFLKDPIIRQFGQNFYAQMEEAYQLLMLQKEKK